jgi:hypothetical protein
MKVGSVFDLLQNLRNVLVEPIHPQQFKLPQWYLQDHNNKQLCLMRIFKY